MSVTTPPSSSSDRSDDADDAPRLLWLADPRAADTSLTGAKASKPRGGAPPTCPCSTAS